MNEDTERIVANAKRKLVSASESSATLIVTLPEGYEDVDDAAALRMAQLVKAQVGYGVNVIVVPHGTETRLVHKCYQRELLGEYEYEVAAATEEEMGRRLEKWFPRMPK